MPELPEVETVVRGLYQRLLGRKITGVEIFKPLVLKAPRAEFVAAVTGQIVESVSRHGKCIFLKMNDRYVKIHLGMTGALLFREKEKAIDPYVRIRFRLEDAVNDLVFRDVRQFGKVTLTDQPFEKNWGPDAWISPIEDLFDVLRKKKGMIKHALMNQNVLAGLGNIYVDETLFGAGVHPKKRLEKLSDQSIRLVVAASRRVLTDSIKLGGTTFRDYVNTEGKRGNFKMKLNVYGQESKPCTVCGTRIKKITVVSRGTHFCPKCQKK